MNKKTKKYTFRNYIEYIKDNPKGLWFKMRLYGWGWVPVKWQGWVVVLGFIGFVTYMAVAYLIKGRLIEYFASLIISILILIYIGYKKGERPKWSWGRN